MIPLKDNKDIASFLVTKHSWKGKYKRVFSIGSHGITTYNPEKFEVTNRWPYSEIVTIATSKHSNNANNVDFVLQMKKDRKVDTMKFSSEHKAIILTEALKFRHSFAEKPKEYFRYEAYKHHWSDIRLPVILEAGPCSLDQLDPATMSLLASYPYHQIEGIIAVQDYPNGFVVVCGGFSRLHLFTTTQFSSLRNKILELSNLTLNINIKVLNTTITMDDFHNQRFGKFSGDIHQTSLSEFPIQKINPIRHIDPQKRILCLTETCLIERDPQSYTVCTLKPLASVFALIRDNDDPQLFNIEFLNGSVAYYKAAERDAILASILDGVRWAGSRDVHVRMIATPRGKRHGPLDHAVDEETESYHLRLFQNPCNMLRNEVIERFNANVGYSGLLYSVNQDRLFSENKEKLIAQALSNLMQINSVNSIKDKPLLELENMFQALRRLCASKAGYAAFTSLPGFREWVGGVCVSALRRENTALSHAALDGLCALLQPMHSEPDLRQEQSNKCSMLSSKPFLTALLDMTIRYANEYSGSLVVAAMLDFLTFSLCAPYSETTEGKLFDQLLELVALRGRDLFKLFEHPSLAIVKGAGLVMRALIQEGTDEIGAKMQSLSMSEAVVLRHLIAGLYPRQRSAQLTTLSRHLVSLWTEQHEPAVKALQRVFPQGLLAFLDSKDAVPANAYEANEERDNLYLAQKSNPQTAPSQLKIKVQQMEKHLQHYTNLALQHWAQHTGMVIERNENAMRDRPVILRKRRERIKCEKNWALFYFQFDRDHALPNLIWNHTTREELRNALEAELRQFQSERELASGEIVAWNHLEFRVDYPSLQQECKVAHYYLRLLLERPDEVLTKCYEFFNELYHRYLTSSKVEMKCMCLQAMTIVYDKYYDEIGPFPDTSYLLHILDRTCELGERDRLISCCVALARHSDNVRALAGSARMLIELAALAHTHQTRAMVPALHKELRAASENEIEELKEWHYSDGENRYGPFSLTQMKELYANNKINNRTRVWARGMEAWRQFNSVAQLKWSVGSNKNSSIGVGAHFDPSQLATAILALWLRCCTHLPARNEENAIIRPLPRIKRLLGDSETLPHLVQLLLTFDPIIVEKVATLLYEIMKDNPEMPKVYLTGVFYFILMYTGSNVLPIAKFLHLTHMKQAFRADENATSDIMQQSILGQLLPEAMVCYLHNHGPEKFAQIFLGEFDTPEAIWNSEMRNMLTMKISAHISEFTPRLRANVLARYAYLPIPAVRYPQLDHELFCHIFYLRHLCDEQKFSNWPIPDPIRLLKEVLSAWKAEVSREPGSISATTALKTLNLDSEADDQSIRRAYYKLAHQFHPDRDPNGREMFEKVNAAYEYLCSRNVWKGDGPNPDNIILILRTQTILFERYTEKLSEYAYAGYEALVRTMKLEAESDSLFNSDKNSVLPNAIRLAHATLQCCALNVDELVRAGGLQVLSGALQRCASVVTVESKIDDVSVQVCEQCARCFAVAAQFPQALQVMQSDQPLLDHIAQLLALSKLHGACCASAKAVGGLCRSQSARRRLTRNAALTRLIALTLIYDHTMTKTDLETNANTNKQERINQMSLAAIDACAQFAANSSEENDSVCDQSIVDGLKRLFTPYLYAKLFDADHAELLELLTSNSRTPYLIWDNSTRCELEDFLDKVQPYYEEGDDFPFVHQSFHYSAHDNLLVIGGIFVEIYNENPSFVIQNPRQFVLDLLSFIKQNSLEKLNEKRILKMEMALEALANVITHNQGVEIQCIGQFGVLFSLLKMDSRIRDATLKVLSASTTTKDCLEDIAAEQVLGYLLVLLPDVRDDDLSVLNIFNALIVNTRIVKEALSKGGVLYLLELFSRSRSQEIRVMAAQTMTRMIADKLHGPKVARFLQSWLPEGIVQSITSDTPVQSINIFDSTHETPELLWDEHSKKSFNDRLRKAVDSHRESQLLRHDVSYHLDTTQLEVNNEIVVGGVYLRLYCESPTWPLRSPRNFLQELLNETIACVTTNPQQERSEVCAKSLSLLLRARPALCEATARLGHLPSLTRMINKAPELMLPSLALLASAQSCVIALAQTDIVIQMRETLKSSPELTELCCLVLSELYSAQCNTEQLVYQALEYQLVESLLKVLEECEKGSGQGGAARAVKALRFMSESPLHGQRVKALLAGSQAWQKYSSLKQDLFVPDSRNALTAAPSRTAGYLTSGSAHHNTQQPPPLH